MWIEKSKARLLALRLKYDVLKSTISAIRDKVGQVLIDVNVFKVLFSFLPVKCTNPEHLSACLSGLSVLGFPSTIVNYYVSLMLLCLWMSLIKLTLLLYTEKSPGFYGTELYIFLGYCHLLPVRCYCTLLHLSSTLG